ncbi:hypothetical protein ATK36_4410 [Amycolatopsis sulphurea]|uniref:Uncharacterized protein n=1 Tax=Amycolatopsis sulphurea TaxID=76022 RepID=A0A2A9FFT2_9PSEU|nr:hypothetical protein ATK36_4410 [Amycolatopsis sulphurea]
MQMLARPLLLTRRRVVDEGRRTVSACRRSMAIA